MSRSNLLVSLIQDWLTSKTTKFELKKKLNSTKRFDNQIPSFAVPANHTYSAFVEEVATICRVLFS